MQSFPFPPLPWRRPPVMRWPKPDQPYALQSEVNGVKHFAEGVKKDLSDHENNEAIHVTAENKAAWNGKYEKPSTGIPKADLASDVKASLAKADTALQSHQDISGKADLVDGKVPSSQLPSYVDDVLEYASCSAFPATGEDGKIYIAKDANTTYRWSGTTYVQIGGGEIPVPVAPSTDQSASGKPADAKATGDALAGKVSKSGDTMTGALKVSLITGKTTVDAESVTIENTMTALGTSYGREAIVRKNVGQTVATIAIPAGSGTLALVSDISVKSVKRNGTALTPDSNGAVDVTVPTGTAASKDVPTSGNASSTQVVMGNDTRLSNARTPTAHKSSHSSGGSDELTGADLVVGGSTSIASSTIASTIEDLTDKKADTSSLATVATTGLYSDLTGTPTIPAAQVQSNWNETNTSSKAYIQNKPTIPTVPTNVSAFANDAGYLTAHQDISGKLDATKRNLLDYTTGTTLALGTAVYRANLASDGTFPTITDTAITSSSAYFQFELELTVPSAVPSTITGPTGWTWLDGHGLPDPADLSGGETIYVSVRLDCTARTFLASVWRVA